jgi:hypothetical protein
VNEEKVKERGSVFALVLGRFMEARDIPVLPESFDELARKSGLDGPTFRARLAGDMEADPGNLTPLADVLGLSEPEKLSLALAYVFEREPEVLEDAREREEMLEHLTVDVGMSREGAKRAMRDDDLWIVQPSLRMDLPDEEAVEQWSDATYVLDALVTVADRIGLGTMVAIMDARERADVALKRTRARLREASRGAR